MTHVVVIVKDGSSYTVVNGRMIVKPEDTVRLHNYAGAKAEIKFEGTNPFGKDLGLEFELPDGETIGRENLELGYYPYAVTLVLESGKESAQASRPIIIVYP